MLSDTSLTSPHPRFTRADAARLAGVIALATLLALPVLTYPLGRDQGMYANIARSILEGGTPFVDMWDIKPPAIYYLYAAGIALFGGGSAGIRALDLALVPLAMAGVYLLSLRLTGRWLAAWFAALLLPVFYFTETFASLTQSDSLVLIPMTWAVVAAVWSQDAPRAGRAAVGWAFVCGALCALTMWFKHYYALIVLALVAEQVIRRRGVPMREALAFTLGGALAGGVPAVFFLTNGVWAEMLIVAEGTAAYNRQASQSFSAFVDQLGHYLGFRWQHWGVLIVLALAWLVAPGVARGWRWRVVGLWLVAGLAFVAVQAKGFDTHWLPLLPPLCLLAGATLAGGLDRVQQAAGNPRLSRALSALLVVGLCAILVKDTWVRATPYLTGAQSQMAYYRHFQGNDVKAWESLRVVNFLRERTTPGDTLFVWGFRPEVTYLSDLRPATRYQAHFPLVAEWWPPQWRQENVDLLWAARPPFVLVLQADYLPWVTGVDDDSAVLLTQYKPLEDWLIFNYERVRTMGDFIIWQRKDLIDAERPADGAAEGT